MGFCSNNRDKIFLHETNNIVTQYYYYLVVECDLLYSIVAPLLFLEGPLVSKQLQSAMLLSAMRLERGRKVKPRTMNVVPFGARHITCMSKFNPAISPCATSRTHGFGGIKARLEGQWDMILERGTVPPKVGRLAGMIHTSLAGVVSDIRWQHMIKV